MFFNYYIISRILHVQVFIRVLSELEKQVKQIVSVLSSEAVALWEVGELCKGSNLIFACTN